MTDLNSKQENKIYGNGKLDGMSDIPRSWEHDAVVKFDCKKCKVHMDFENITESGPWHPFTLRTGI